MEGEDWKEVTLQQQAKQHFKEVSGHLSVVALP
jgi:hypothetical protein